MDMMLTAYGEDEEINISVPINKIIKEHWKGSTPPDVLTVSTGLGDEVAQASFVLDEESSSHQSIALSTENKKTCRQCSWFRLELPNETNDMVKGHLYGGDDDMETDQPLAIIVDGVRDTNDESKRALWVDKEVTHIESLTDDYQERQKAITEKQIADLDVGDYLKDFDYAAYGKRLSSKAENTVEFVADTIVSRRKQEIDLVANGMEAMGLSVVTGYFDPDDEPTDDVPKQLTGFYYVRMSAEA